MQLNSYTAQILLFRLLCLENNPARCQVTVPLWWSPWRWVQRTRGKSDVRVSIAFLLPGSNFFLRLWKTLESNQHSNDGETFFVLRKKEAHQQFMKTVLILLEMKILWIKMCIIIIISHPLLTVFLDSLATISGAMTPMVSGAVL